MYDNAGKYLNVPYRHHLTIPKKITDNIEQDMTNIGCYFTILDNIWQYKETSNNVWQKYCQYLKILENSDQLMQDQTVLKSFWVDLHTVYYSTLHERVLERAFAC